jgi:hypothetical protein
MNARTIVGLALCAILTGCDDSKNPLSDPQTSKPDERLVGVWQLPDKGGATYYHIGHAGKPLPEGVMRVAFVRHEKGKIESPGEFLMFPTVLGEKTYLNVTDLKGQRGKRSEEQVLKAGNSYYLFRYQVDGDKLAVWVTNAAAKKRAIDDGKIKGVIEKNKPAKFTDTTENVARFVAETGDGLFSKEPLRLERVEMAGKR